MIFPRDRNLADDRLKPWFGNLLLHHISLKSCRSTERDVSDRFFKKLIVDFFWVSCHIYTFVYEVFFSSVIVMGMLYSSLLFEMSISFSISIMFLYFWNYGDNDLLRSFIGILLLPLNSYFFFFMCICHHLVQLSELL